MVILGCIGKQVVEYLVQLVGIEEHHTPVHVALDGEVNLLLLHQRPEPVHTVAYKLHQIPLGDLQFQVAGLGLTELQYLLQQAYQPVDVVRHHFILLLVNGSRLLQFVYGSGNDGQRRQQFVGDIGEELQFGMVDFLRLRLLHLAQVKRIAQADTVAHNQEDIPGYAG